MDLELNNAGDSAKHQETPHSLLSTVGHIQDEVRAVAATENHVERSTRINACLSFIIASSKRRAKEASAPTLSLETNRSTIVVVAMSVYIVNSVESNRGLAIGANFVNDHNEMLTTGSILVVLMPRFCD